MGKHPLFAWPTAFAPKRIGGHNKSMPLKIEVSKKIQHFIVASDWHSEHIHLPSFEILLKLAEKLGANKTSLIILGDFLDVPYLMKKDENFQKWSKRSDSIDSYFLPQLEEESMFGNSVLDRCQDKFKKIIYVEGNHELRVRWFAEQEYCPAAYKHQFCLKNQLRLSQRSIDFVEYNDWVDIGDNLSLTHGMYHGPSALKKHFDAAGKSVIYGHVHSAEVKAFSCRGKTKKAWSLPTMGTLSPEYLKNAVNPWTNGFALVSLKPNGHFQIHVLEIWDDELVLPTGEVLRGNR